MLIGSWTITLTFEAIADNEPVVFTQHKCLPIGGHLSSAFCELVALKREYCSWPVELSSRAKARYRDNYFLAFEVSPNVEC